MEKYESYRKSWEHEQSVAKIHGWDFSHISGRYESEEDSLPWDYKSLIKQHLQPEHRLLDIDTGGGEFLLSLAHPHANTAATEGYPPNIRLCQERLLTLGIDFRGWAHPLPLPFEDGSFDIIINRHGAFDIAEIRRILRRGGLFITQQVGEENDIDLINLLSPDGKSGKTSFPGWNLKNNMKAFKEQGVELIFTQEAFPTIRFFDVGALVWFARIIEWEFPGFSVENSFDRLCRAQELLEAKGEIKSKAHRFVLVARRK
ncbi:MAG: class I SAM-dependent methyltransferase [Christensenellales bacterium]|jgi:SAM-dependent methyltransferase